MKIFISYSSRHKDVCERLRLALEGEGHEPFVDRVALQAGQPFDARLRDAVEQSDLFIFLISPESVAPGSYALAELSIAEQRWGHPRGRVLPVRVAPTPKDAIPPYLRAVTILEPQGDVIAETLAAVQRYSRRAGPRAAVLAAVLIAAVALAAAVYWQWRGHAEDNRRAAVALTAAQQLCGSGDHALAWQRFEEAVQKFTGSRELRTAREDCAMRWLREVRVREGQETFTEVVARTLPVLAEGLALASGQRAADLRAHFGWADFLRTREGAPGLEPALNYRKALGDDPANVFAHAMWGHYLMVKRGPMEEARGHFEAAIASGRERAFVRRFQFAAMLYSYATEAAQEALRIADAMRAQGEKVEPGDRNRLWSYVYARLLRKAERPELLAALSGRNALETFLWLYPENDVRPDRRKLWQFYAGVLEEAAGEKTAARLRFERLLAELEREDLSGALQDETADALRRLEVR